jgi:endoglucanase
LSGNNHFTVITDGKDVGPVIQLSLWPQSIREFRAPSFAARGGEVHIVDASEVVYYSFIKLPKALTPGTSYQITDQWGNSATFVYDEDSTVSYALKVNQTGYLPDAGEKYAYLGAWLGASGGALDLSRFEGKPFSICNEADHQAVFTGTIAFRRDESSPIPGYTADGANINLSGEKVYQLDFSVFTKPGKYYIKVPGLGRSWGFEIGQNAMGEAFYIHARGLYHQRCAPLDQAFTPWSRGDAHHPIKKAYHPTELGAYGVGYDGWGFIDDATGKFPVDDLGNFMVIDAFPVITATKSEEIVSDSSGEWHDAGDFSLDGYNHLRVVEYLTEAYLMYPANFSDNQLNIPEHDNGIPDIIDEAIWGTDLWRRLQEPDGRVAVYVEAESHPRILDPSVDTEQYYQGLATRNSSLFYAEHAARLVRALKQVGSSAATKAQLFLDSAKKAYAFAETSYDILPRISAKFTLEGKNITWIEPSSLDSDRQVKALVQLWLASGDRTYYDALNSSEMAQAFNKAVGSLYWRDFGFDFVDVALAPEKFPTGWGGTATTGIVSTATKWINWQSNDAYRKLWPTIGGDGYWGSTGWGNSGFVELLHVIPAWRLTGEERFRTGALLAVDWLHGANPQGRVNTTGLGKNYVVQPLHDPSDSDGIADPVPGITIYGYTFGIPWNGSRTVYGLFDDPSPVYDFNGSFLAQLPPPWDITGMDISAIKDVLKNKIPLWRNIITLEGSAVGWMEFDVASTVGPAAAITGCLLGPGWMPSDNLKNRRPKSEIELKDALWYQP